MFSKFGPREATADSKKQEPVETAMAAVAHTSVPQQQAAPQPKPNVSFIGKGVELKGELIAGEDLLIHGKLEGSVRNKAKNLVIGVDGSLKANVDGKSIVVQGSVNGDIHGAESVIIESSARVQGNISSSSIGVEKGARFKGSLDTYSDAPAAEKRVSEQQVDKILDS